MKHASAVVLAVALAVTVALPCASTVMAQDAVQTADAVQTTDAVRAADAWLQKADAGTLDETWTSASASFRAAIGQAPWLGQLRAARAPLGALGARTLGRATYTRNLPNAPAGEYVVVEYLSRYANRDQVSEVVIPVREPDGSWKVSGYFIR